MIDRAPANAPTSDPLQHLVAEANFQNLTLREIADDVDTLQRSTSELEHTVEMIVRRVDRAAHAAFIVMRDTRNRDEALLAALASWLDSSPLRFGEGVDS